MREKAHNTVARITIFVIALVIMMIAYVTFLLVYPSTVLKFTFEKTPVLVKKVVQGDVLPVRYTFEKYIDSTTVVTKKFVNTVVVTIPDTLIYREKGKYDFVGYSLVVPEHLPPGIYHVQSDYYVHVNWLRTDHISIKSDTFEVLEKKKPHDDEEDEALIRKFLKMQKGEIK